MSTPRRSLAKRAVRWITATLNEQITGVGSVVFFDALGNLTLIEKNEVRRVLRAHVRFYYKNNVANAQAFGRYGLIVQNDDAIASGTSAGLLTPINDSGASWMLNDHFYADSNVIGPMTRVDTDARAGRLINPGFSLLFALETSVAANDAVAWAVAMRILVEHR